jgi:type IV pilus assembly protein PilA
LPAYQDFSIRARVVEGLGLAGGARLLVNESASTAVELAEGARFWNDEAGGRGVYSKYVRSILIDEASGEVTITFDEIGMGGPASATLVYTPYVRTTAGTISLADSMAGPAGVRGAIDWGCASATNTVAASRGLPALTAGTLPARLAPGECR